MQYYWQQSPFYPLDLQKYTSGVTETSWSLTSSSHFVYTLTPDTLYSVIDIKEFEILFTHTDYTACTKVRSFSICSSMFILFHLDLISSMWLQVDSIYCLFRAEQWSRSGCVDRLHSLSYPLIHWQILGLFLKYEYCNQCCSRHKKPDFTYFGYIQRSGIDVPVPVLSF